MIAPVEVGGLDRRYHATFEAILLPLLHTGETVTRVLGALSAIDSPAWLGHERLTKKRLIAHELIWPEGRPHLFADKMREPAPLKTSLAGARLVRFDRRSFRVLDGGRSGPGPSPGPSPGPGSGPGPGPGPGKD